MWHKCEWASEQGSQVSAMHSVMLQLGQLFFEDTVFVPGLWKTIISLGQFDAQGCSTKTLKGKMEVYSPTNQFLFSAFLHAGKYFLNTEIYSGHAIKKQEHSKILADAVIDNCTELWHCRLVMWTGWGWDIWQRWWQVYSFPQRINYLFVHVV